MTPTGFPQTLCSSRVPQGQRAEHTAGGDGELGHLVAGWDGAVMWQRVPAPCKAAHFIASCSAAMGRAQPCAQRGLHDAGKPQRVHGHLAHSPTGSAPRGAGPRAAGGSWGQGHCEAEEPRTCCVWVAAQMPSERGKHLEAIMHPNESLPDEVPITLSRG